jgi:hypothetical protein
VGHLCVYMCMCVLGLSALYMGSVFVTDLAGMSCYCKSHSRSVLRKFWTHIQFFIYVCELLNCSIVYAKFID